MANKKCTRCENLGFEYQTDPKTGKRKRGRPFNSCKFAGRLVGNKLPVIPEQCQFKEKAKEADNA